MDKPNLRALPQKPTTKKSPPLFGGNGYTADWLADQIFAEVVYAVPGLVTEGFNLLVGPPKAGKSWLTLGIALNVATGTPALGYIETTPRKVLLLALEDSQKRMQKRCRQILGHNDLPQNLTVFHRVVPDRLAHDMKMWLYEHYDEEAPPLIILDTLAKGMPQGSTGNESAYARDYRIGAALKDVADEYSGTAVVAIHHDRKAEVDDFIDAVSGTHGLAGAADTIIVMQRSRLEDSGVIKVTGRDVSENEYAIETAGDGRWLLSSPSLESAAKKQLNKELTSGVGDISKQIIEFVSDNAPVTTKQVTQQFGPNARKYLTRLAEANRIIRVGYGEYSIPSTNTNYDTA